MDKNDFIARYILATASEWPTKGAMKMAEIAWADYEEWLAKQPKTLQLKGGKK